MRTNDRFWKLFANTGSIYAYLMYRQVNGATANS
jgi:3-methyladenine DNA glycosylase Mpg